jgi:hypothetical protein
MSSGKLAEAGYAARIRRACSASSEALQLLKADC